MQNKCCSANDAGYVSLNGGWRCAGCGWANQSCDCCAKCGWNRCGCQGGVVRTANESARSGCACDNGGSRDRDRACDDCPASFTCGHRVQCCPDNTRIRRDDDCGCKGQYGYQGRSNDGKDDCGCKGQYGYQGRGNDGKDDCGCKDGKDARRGGRNAHVGIVHAVKQELEDVYESESALRTGTLFPELHKPMNGRCPACSNCSTCQQQAAFAAWDLRLYLNTHPDDEEAKALFRRLRAEADEPNYATTFLKDGCCGSDWSWTDDPWPWECQPCGK